MITYNESDIQTTPFSKLSVFSYTNIVHKHTFYELTIILQGEANSVINDGTIQLLQQGDLILIRPQDTHSIQPKTKDYLHRDFYISAEKMQRIVALFGKDFTEEYLNKKENYFHLNLEETSLIEKKSYVFNMQSAQSSNISSYLDKIHTALIIEIFGCILADSLPMQNTIPQWLSNLYLHLTSFHYVNLSIEEIIRHTGYSHSYVCAIFKKTYNITIQDCLTRSKIILSANMLGNEKIIDIAASFGWENPKNYTLAFKKVYGMTPTQYKKQHRSNGNTRLLYPDPPKMEKLSDFEKIVEP